MYSYIIIMLIKIKNAYVFRISLKRTLVLINLIEHLIYNQQSMTIGEAAAIVFLHSTYVVLK